MAGVDLYVFLPNEINIYNKCFIQTDFQYNKINFLENLKFVRFGLQSITINHIYYIGDDLFETDCLQQIFQVFKQYKQYFLTNGINIENNIQLIKEYIFQLDICRASLDQNENMEILNSTFFPNIQHLQKSIEICKSNNIRTRIVVPLQDGIAYNFTKFVQFANYLYSDILFRKLSFNKIDSNSAYQFFENQKTICFDFKQNYQVIVKKYNDTFVWIESIYSNINKNNYDYIVLQPNGCLTNQFRNCF